MIANSVRTCLRNLQRLYDGARDAENEAGSQKNASLLSRQILSILDHFKLWVHDFGAEGGSLDKRLERSSHVRQIVTQDLDRLEHILQQGLPETILITEDMHATVDDLQCIIDGLFDVFLAIQSPEPDVADEIRIDPYIGADLLHAERSFPKAQKGLLERLATANFLRRRHLIRLRDRHETGPDTDSRDQSVLGSTSSPTSEFSDIFDQSYSSGETGTESSCASDEDTSRSRLPPPPAAVYEQKSFKCPICFKHQTNIKSWSSWKKHVFADLQAYICTFEDCPRKASMFSSRGEWYAHELEQHQSKPLWVCWDNARQTFTSEEAFEDHMRTDHAGSFADHQLSSISNFCKQIREEGVSECSLCEDSKRYIKMGRQRHIGQHLEGLALFALPNLDKSSGELDSEDSDSSVEEPEVDPTAETRTLIAKILIPRRRRRAIVNYLAKQPLKVNQLDPPSPVDADVDYSNATIDDRQILKGTPGFSYESLDPSYRTVDVMSSGTTTGRTPNPWRWSAAHDDYYRTEWVPQAGHPAGGYTVNIFSGTNSHIPATSAYDNGPRNMPVPVSNDPRAGGSGGSDIERLVQGYGAGPSGQYAFQGAGNQSISASRLGPSPSLVSGGYHAPVTPENESLIQGTPETSYESLDPSYRLVDDEWKFFVRGRVFQMLLIENASKMVPPGSTNPSLVHYGDRAYARISRFVVVEAVTDRHYSKCIPISTYSGRATAGKSSAVQREHGIIYTGDRPPERLEQEVYLYKDPIKVIVTDLSMKLSTDSRINYALTRPIEHNVKVKNIGMIAKNDMFKVYVYWSSYR